MINFTPMARALMMQRVRAARTWRGDGIEKTQRRVLAWLTRRGAVTEYGRGRIVSTDDADVFRRAVPTVAYADIRPMVLRMIDGQSNILWPGKVRRYAQSSGTGDGRSKYIPISNDSLRLNHYRGATDAVAHYLALYPDSRMFSGKGFILGGSFANTLDRPAARGVKVGDLSANLIDDINPVVNLVRVPSKHVALMEDWTLKVPALVRAARGANVTNISGVPSWFMTVIKEVIKSVPGAETIHDVWPNLEVFFHGGISMAPYRDEYDRLCDGIRMRYQETYNASEGFFAVQDLREHDKGMLLLLDAGVFYEFVPLEHCDDPFPPSLTAWQVEAGKTYAMVITAANGLWRYRIGDTVCITSIDPLRIAIAGRTAHYINAFGEEVMVHNTDAALAAACAATGAGVRDYTVAPVFADSGHRGRHQWLIEWNVPPRDLEDFAQRLDDALRSVNSDYDAKRSGNIFLGRLSITVAAPGLFERWLASTGKLGGQRKVPRLSNDRHIMDAITALGDAPESR